MARIEPPPWSAAQLLQIEYVRAAHPSCHSVDSWAIVPDNWPHKNSSRNSNASPNGPSRTQPNSARSLNGSSGTGSITHSLLETSSQQ